MGCAAGAYGYRQLADSRRNSDNASSSSKATGRQQRSGCYGVPLRRTRIIRLQKDCRYMTQTEQPNNFVEQIIERDLASGQVPGNTVVTRFPPEPNGYLHIGHAVAICLNFGLAEKYQGHCHLRFDDTNPEKEAQVYVDAIQEDVRWLGFQWTGPVRYASNYFEQLYQWAQHLILAGKAYVDHQSSEQIRITRGDFHNQGRSSPWRDRSVEENLAELEKMRAGEYDEGQASLRAKIDMQSSNMNLRDPVLYRIRKIAHHQTGTDWCIYPSYDFAHGQEDAIEGITHSLCTLEFQDHRPLYEWFLENMPVPSRPRQYEFARSNLSSVVTSKRKLKELVDHGVVSGWDDPRLPTITGLRRRGYTAQAIRTFADMVGVSRTEGVADISMLEHAVRDHLNREASRAMAVISPLKVVITNVAEEEVLMLHAAVHPDHPERGERQIPLTREIFIDRRDFNEDSTLSRKKFKRLVPGEYVRLRSAWIIRADEVIKNDDGDVVALHCSYLPDTIGQNPPAGIRPRGVIHWVSASHSREAELRLYSPLLTDSPADEPVALLDRVRPDSLQVVKARIEPALLQAQPEQRFQFEREGYFVADRYDHSSQRPVFNRTIELKENRPL